MNAIQVQCGQCKRRFAAQPHLAGKPVKGPRCKAPLSIPDPDLEVLREGIGSRDPQIREAGRLAMRKIRFRQKAEEAEAEEEGENEEDGEK